MKGALLRQALAYAGDGLAVFPLLPGDKRPLPGSHGCKDASTDAAQIREWWRARPDANVGVATGERSGVVVLDVDTKNGHDGARSLEALRLGVKTRESRTPSGGRHLWFARPDGAAIRNSAGKLGDGLDVRGDGGYVVAPPSVVQATAYRWLNKRPYAPLPADLIERLGAPLAPAVAAAIPAGARNDTLFREACRFRSAGIDQDDALARLRGLNEAQCSPPLGDAELKQIVQSAWRYPPGFERSDTGNARRLIHHRGLDVRYVIETEAFHIWNGARWAEDAQALELTHLLKQTNQLIWEEAQRLGDPDQQKRHGAYAVASQNIARLRGAIESAKSEPGVAMRAAEFDADPWLLGIKNGVVDLRAGDFRAAAREDYISKSAGCAFEPRADCPGFRAFLASTFTPPVAAYVQRLMGYALTGLTTEQSLYCLIGVPAAGKSVLLEAVKDLMGDYGRGVRTEVLMAHARAGKGGASEDEARLVGARFVSANETADGMHFNESLIKDLTGGDTVTARRLYENSFEFRPQFKLFIRGNHKPQFNGDDGGMARRIKLLPFTVPVPERERDPGLGARLRGELSGILNFAIEGCLEWQRGGMREPDTVRDATREYLVEMDTIGEFIGERCVLDKKAREASGALYGTYRAWCEDGGYRPLAIKRFVQKLEERGLAKRRTNTWRGFDGIALRPDGLSKLFGDVARGDTSDTTSEKYLRKKNDYRKVSP